MGDDISSDSICFCFLLNLCSVAHFFIYGYSRNYLTNKARKYDDREYNWKSLNSLKFALFLRVWIPQSGTTLLLRKWAEQILSWTSPRSQRLSWDLFSTTEILPLPRLVALWQNCLYIWSKNYQAFLFSYVIEVWFNLSIGHTLIKK